MTRSAPASSVLTRPAEVSTSRDLAAPDEGAAFLTEREQAVLDYVRGHILRWGRAPHYREIGAHVGVSHVTASGVLRRLAFLGLIHLRPRCKRGIALPSSDDVAAVRRAFAYGRFLGRMEAGA